MKFETVRSLKNKVFNTSIVRVIEQNDPCLATEKQLEDDFGSVMVETGGKFEAYVTLAVGAKPTFSKVAKSTPGEFLFKFATDTIKMSLIPTVDIPFICDSEKESPRKDALGIVINPLEVAQLKCEMFESIIKERIAEAVVLWKTQTTDFETVVIPAFDQPLC